MISPQTRIPQLQKDIKGQSIPHQEKHFKPLHLLFLIVIFLLLCTLTNLYQTEEQIQKILGQSLNKEKNNKEIINRMQKQLKQQRDEIQNKQKKILANLQTEKILKNTIHDFMIEKYHVKKIQLLRKSVGPIWNDRARNASLLSINNFKFHQQNHELKQQVDQLLRIQYQRLSKTYNLSLPQKDFCVVVPTIDNNQNFRNIYNLRSILNQNYTNYKVVILDDASNDKNFEVISQYIQENPVPQKIHLVQNKKRQGTVFNIYQAATKYCHREDIMLLVDGDDQLLGVNVLKVFNSVYSTRDLQVVYSNLIVYNTILNQAKIGWSSAYSEDEKKRNIYRQDSTRMFPVRTFKVSTFLKIQQKNLKNNVGQWFMSASDQAICPQVLQLSCGKNDYINEYFYLYNFGLGSNDIEINADFNYGIMHTVRNRPKYQCPK